MFRDLRHVTFLASIGALVMLLALSYGFLYGNFEKEGKAIMGMLWGRITLIDVYVGLILICAWVLWREHNIAISLAWITAILLLGNLASCCYVIRALAQSKGCVNSFWLGVGR